MPKYSGGARRNAGFVLLATLVFLLLASILLVGLARYSLSIVAEAQEQQERLQRRWGIYSLRTLLLSRPNETIAGYISIHCSEGQDPRQLYPIAGSIALGNLTFRLLLDDESRKLNLNRLYQTEGTDAVRASLMRLRQGALIVRLRPRHGAAGDPITRPFESWGQVYAMEELQEPLSRVEWIAANTRNITCWGGGKIHYGMCSDEVLREAAQCAVDADTAEKLVDRRRRNPRGVKLPELLDQLNIEPAQKSRLKEWLTDRSDSYSLWVDVEGGEHCGAVLSIAEAASDRRQVMYQFVW